MKSFTKLIAVFSLVFGSSVFAQTTPQSTAYLPSCPNGSVHIYVGYTYLSNGKLGYAIPCIAETDVSTDKGNTEIIKAVQESAKGDIIITFIQKLRQNSLVVHKDETK